MSEEEMPPAFVLIEGELFWAFDRWRTLQGYALDGVAESFDWMLHLHQQPTCPVCGVRGEHEHEHEGDRP